VKVRSSTGRNYDLTGAIDMHVHSAPDVVPRLVDDVQVARQAEMAGMEAVVLKSHLFSTVGRAWLVDKMVTGVRVFGGVVLNQGTTGGLNAEAVQANLALGAKVIWMPTMVPVDEDRAVVSGTALRYQDLVGQTRVDLRDPETVTCVGTILAHIAAADAVLATGHLAPTAVRALVELAMRAGVTKILVTHPDSPLVGMPIHEQVGLSRQGVYFERCAYSIVDEQYGVPVAEIGAAIRATGVEHNVISSDLGQIQNPAPVDGLRIFCEALAGEGFGGGELAVMTKANPRLLLGAEHAGSASAEAD
jgi:hypothetical protein